MCQSIVAGGVYFDEFAELSGWRAFAFSAGLIAAIAGAVGMGCASFVAESHALISYTLLPGVASCACHQGETCSSDKQDVRPAWQPASKPSTRVTAYGLQFAGLAHTTVGPTEMQLQVDPSAMSPHCENSMLRQAPQKTVITVVLILLAARPSFPQHVLLL